jgi:hypothetical protein
VLDQLFGQARLADAWLTAQQKRCPVLTKRAIETSAELRQLCDPADECGRASAL